MARIGLSDIAALPDPLQSYQFEWFVPSIPGSGDGRGLTLRCNQASIPGETKDEVEVSLHGITLKFAGRTTFTHEVSLQFQETRDLYVIMKLKAWLAYSKDIIATTGAYKAQYSTTSKLYLYDDTQSIIATVNIYNSFIKSMSDVQLDGTQSSAVPVQATLSYDYTQIFAGKA
jgi:hypothetical protein